MFPRDVTKKIEEIAKAELNETPQKRKETLKHIEEWLKKQPHICIRTDGLWLLNFIRGCKFSTQKTKQKIESFLISKDKVPEVYSNRDPLLPPLQDMLKKGFIIPFGTPDKECVLIRWEDYDPSKVYFTDIMKLAMMVLDLFMNKNETCMAVGHYVIIDCKGFPLTFLTQFTPFNVKRIIFDVLLAYPLRIKSVSIINCVAGIEKMYNLSKSFLSAKLRDRISFFGDDYSKIFEVIPKQYFPKEYGGDADSFNKMAEVWKEEIENNRSWFLDDSMCFLNDVKKSSVLNPQFITKSLEGSFRKLEID